MKKQTKAIFYMLLISGVVFLFFLLLQPLQIYLFQNDIALLFPKGIIAEKQLHLLLIIQALMLIVVIPVFILTFIFSWHYRAENKKATYDPDLVDHKIAEFIWWGVPLIIIAIIGVITWNKTYELDPYKPFASDKKPVKIQVVALQWKWLFIYPEEEIASINFFQFPKEVPLQFEITADAPMNSFWIPAIGGQIYAMPGMRTKLHLMADQEGEFRGSSANISGKGFAGMHFIAKASSQEDYQKWVDEIKKSGKELSGKEYETIALPSENVPPSFFQLKDEHLFHQIVMKYMKES